MRLLMLFFHVVSRAPSVLDFYFFSGKNISPNLASPLASYRFNAANGQCCQVLGDPYIPFFLFLLLLLLVLLVLFHDVSRVLSVLDFFVFFCLAKIFRQVWHRRWRPTVSTPPTASAARCSAIPKAPSLFFSFVAVVVVDVVAVVSCCIPCAVGFGFLFFLAKIFRQIWHR